MKEFDISEYWKNSIRMKFNAIKHVAMHLVINNFFHYI